jgi:tetratricopeptide (TPR) repeat protein
MKQCDCHNYRTDPFTFTSADYRASTSFPPKQNSMLNMQHQCACIVLALACAFRGYQVCGSQGKGVLPHAVDGHREGGSILSAYAAMEFKAGDYGEAIHTASEGIRLYPNSLSNYWVRGSAYLAASNYDLAVQDFQTAVRLNPSNSLAYACLGSAHFLMGNFAGSIQEFTSVIEMDPKNQSAYFNRGSALRAIGNIRSAVSDLTVCIALNPTNAMPHITRAACYDELGEVQKELADLTCALVYSPRQYYLRTMRGSAYARAGDFQKALADFNAAVRSEPLNPVAYNALSWLLATCANESCRNPAEAIRLGQKACSLGGSTRSDYLDTLAAAFAAAGDFSVAVKNEKAAISSAQLAGEAGETQGSSQVPLMRSRLLLYENGKTYIDAPQPMKP